MEENPDQNINVESQTVAPSTPPTPERKSTLPKWIIAAILVVILILIGGASYLLLQKQASNTPNSVTQTTIKPTSVSFSSLDNFISYQVPPGWKKTEDSEGIKIDSPDLGINGKIPISSEDITISRIKYTKDTIDDFLTSLLPITHGKITNKIIGGLPASTFFAVGFEYDQHYVILKESYLWDIRIRYIGAANIKGVLKQPEDMQFKSGNSEINENFINSITFITNSPDETASWKTYANKKFNFAFNYPSDWKLKEDIGDEFDPDYDFTIHLTTTDSAELTFSTHAFGFGGRCNDNTPILEKEKINFMNTDLYIYYYGNKDTNEVSFITIEQYNSPCPNIPAFHIKGQSENDGSEVLNISYKSPIDFKTFKSSSTFLLLKQVLSTFKTINQISPTPIPTCRPRPACLDSAPRCMIAETSDMCPPTITPSL